MVFTIGISSCYKNFDDVDTYASQEIRQYQWIGKEKRKIYNCTIVRGGGGFSKLFMIVCIMLLFSSGCPYYNAMTSAFVPLSHHRHHHHHHHHHRRSWSDNSKKANIVIPVRNDRKRHNDCHYPENIIIIHSSNTNSNYHDSDDNSIQSEGSVTVTSTQSQNDVMLEVDGFLSVLGGNVANCIIESDLKRIGGGDGGGSSGWTSWVDEKSALRVQSCMNLCQLYSPSTTTTTATATITTTSEQQLWDEALRYIRWMKATPSPTCIHLSKYLRQVVSNYLDEYDDANNSRHDKNDDQIDDHIDNQIHDEEEEEENISGILTKIQCTKEELLSRLGLQLFLLPSGSTFPTNLQSPPGSLVYGQLLYGGATRFRILPGRMQRRTGERTSILPTHNNLEEDSSSSHHKAWLQYGGPQRNYQAVDIGPCAILELTILPKGLTMDSSKSELANNRNNDINKFSWHPHRMLQFFYPPNNSTTNSTITDKKSTELDPMDLLDGKEWNDYVQKTFSNKIGGLEPQIQSIVRRVLDGRVFRSIYDDDDDDDDIYDSTEDGTNGSTSAKAKNIAQLNKNQEEAKELELLGLSPVRGLLLYGPPGCGKTALARQISNILKARKPKIVSAPELLDRWVGGSEKLIRELFQDAENELRVCGGDATKSSLHVIVIDEIDAVFRKRTSSEDSGQVSRASAVNQILAKLDGVNAIPNVLIIGMTNRRELLDEALLRPGRLEVQIEIPKPNQEGRRQILKIHFNALRQRGRLSQPLCQAIDGGNKRKRQTSKDDDSNSNSPSSSSKSKKRDKLLKNISNILRQPSTVIPNYHRNTIVDLADPIWTGGFTGADIAGLVRCAGSIALSRARKQGMGTDALLITLEDVHDALAEIKHNNNNNNIIHTQ